MIFSRLNYFLREALHSLVKNRIMTIASVLTVASCIFTVTISYCMAVNINYILSQLGNSINISVIISDEATTDNVNELYNEINALEHVKGVKYISAKEALESFAAKLEDSAQILEGLENDNPLPRSFDIDVDNMDFQRIIIAKLEELRPLGIERIRHSNEVTSVFITINNTIGAISAVLIGILCVVSIVIIMNTIKITVNSRRTEISIMKYVGATDWFVRSPFVIEGVMIGIIGSTFPVLICWMGYDGIVNKIVDRLPMIMNLFEFQKGVAIFPILIPLTVLIGIFIGMFGSFISMRKYLKV